MIGRGQLPIVAELFQQRLCVLRRKSALRMWLEIIISPFVQQCIGSFEQHPVTGTVEQAKKVCYCARKRQTLCEPLYRSRISKSAEKDNLLSANRPDPTVIRSERGMN